MFSDPIVDWAVSNSGVVQNYSYSMNSSYVNPNTMEGMVQTARAGAIGMMDAVMILIVVSFILFTFIRLVGMPNTPDTRFMRRYNGWKTKRSLRTKSIPFYKMILVRLGLAEIKEHD